VIKDVLFKDHSNLVGYFLSGEELTNEEGQVWSPRVHIVLESAVEGLIRENEQVRDVFVSLCDMRTDPHEARRMIGKVFAEILWGFSHSSGRDIDWNNIFMKKLENMLKEVRSR